MTLQTYVSLADPKANNLIFSFWMYDGEDQLHSDAHVVPIEVNKGKHHFWQYYNNHFIIIVIFTIAYMCVYNCSYSISVLQQIIF